MSDFWACWKIFTWLIDMHEGKFWVVFLRGLLIWASDWKKNFEVCKLKWIQCGSLFLLFILYWFAFSWNILEPFPTSSWVKNCLSFSSSKLISGAIWNILASPRLMFMDHSWSWLCALICLILPPLKTTLNGSCNIFKILSSIAVSSSCLGSWSFPVTWWNETFSN